MGSTSVDRGAGGSTSTPDLAEFERGALEVSNYEKAWEALRAPGPTEVLGATLEDAQLIVANDITPGDISSFDFGGYTKSVGADGDVGTSFKLPEVALEKTAP